MLYTYVAGRLKGKKLRFDHSSEIRVNRFSYVIVISILAQTYQSVCAGPTHHASQNYGPCVCAIPPEVDIQDAGIVSYQTNFITVIIIDQKHLDSRTCWFNSRQGCCKDVSEEVIL